MATTALALQLQALSAISNTSSSSFLSKKNNTKPSILFDPQEAADVDSSTLFSFALAGLEELTTENSYFASFKKSLFSVESSQTEREQQGKEFNEKLDASIHNFMSLVSDYLLLSASHQILEYLIRRYSIHIYNVDDLITFTLPYHETSLFVRIVQLANLENTRWHFLSGVKKSGAAPPRELVVQQCLRDMTVLEGICELGHTVVSGKVSSFKTTYSFSATIVIEVLAAAKSVNSALISRILPFIEKCFKKGSSEEYEIGGLMIIGTLTSKASLTEEMSVSLVDLIAKVFNNEVRQVEGGNIIEMGLMVIIQMMQTQPLSFFPDKAFKSMVKIRQLPHILKRITTSFRSEKALSLLIKSLVTLCLSSPHYGNLLQDLIRTLPLQNHAESMILTFLEMCCSQATMTDLMKGEFMKLLLDMKSSFPKELDTSINKFLESHVEAKPVAMGELLSILRDSLDGTLHAVLPSTNQSIYMSLKHPEANIRGLALQQVADVSRRNPEMKVICSEALLLGLHDDDISVVGSVLSIDGLEKLVNAMEFFTSMIDVLSRCNELFEKGARTAKAQASSIARLCLQLLSSSYLDSNPSCVEKIGHVFLNYIFLYPKTWKLNLMALKQSRKLQWSFFRGLCSLKNDILDADVVNDTESKKLWLHDVNTKVVESLANGLWEDLDSLPLEFASTTRNHGTKCFILLVLLKTLSTGQEGLTLDLSKKYFGFLKQEWIDIESSEEFSASKINNDDTIGDSMFTYEFFKTMQQESKLAFGRLVVESFYRVLSSMPLIQTGRKKGYEKSWLNMMEDLFVVFSSSHSRLIFEKHIKLILNRIPISPVVFLSNFFNAEGGTVPVSAQIHSLIVLSCYWDETKDITRLDMQLAVPHLVTALASPIKAIREGACGCLEKLYAQSRHSSSLSNVPNGSQVEFDVLNVDTFHSFLEILLEFRGSFISDGDFLSKFLISTLGSQKEHRNRKDEKELTLRLRKSARTAVFLFLLRNAINFSLYSQYTLFLNLKGVGYMQEQTVETKKMFASLLSRWNQWKFHGADDENLSKIEIQFFQHLLQIHLHHDGMFSLPNSEDGSSIWLKTLMTVLNIGEVAGSIDTDVIEILCSVLSCLDDKIFDMLDSTSQDTILKKLIGLSLLNPEPVQRASRFALHKIQMRPQVIVRSLNGFIGCLYRSSKEPVVQDMGIIESLIAIMEFLLSEHEISGMEELIPVLFDLLRKLPRTMNLENNKGIEDRHISYLESLVLGVIEKIAKSTKVSAKDSMYDVDFLVESIHGANEINTVNQALSLLTTVAQACPDIVLKHVITVFSILGETTMVQDDSHSYIVMEKLISAVVPSWLQKFENPRLLLEIIVKALPDVPSHRRTPLLKTTLRFMQESTSLHLLLLLLIENTVSSMRHPEKLHKKRFRNSNVKAVDLDVKKWSAEFSNSICEEYEIPIRLPGLLNLLKCSGDILLSEEIPTNDSSIVIHDKVVNFISAQLQKIGQMEDLPHQQNQKTFRGVFIEMLEIVLSHLQSLSIKSLGKKVSVHDGLKSLQASLECLLQCITNLLSISAFTEAILHVLRGSDAKMKMRALYLISMKLNSSTGILRQKDSISVKSGAEFSTDPLESYEKLVRSIVDCLEENENVSDLVLSALSALKSCSQILASKTASVFLSSTPILIKNAMQNASIAPVCFQCIASIISGTGSNSLPVLNEVIRGVLEIGKESEIAKEADLCVATLNVLEVIIEKLGCFLSPYLDEILDLLLLQRCFLESTSKILTEKSESVRECLPKMIPVRHLINPLISAYNRCLQKGELSMLACIKMLSLMVSLFDKTSVAAYYTKVFELCLAGFDIRRNPPSCLPSIVDVETSIISLFSALVMKLNEKTFKPLFVRILEWAETEVDNGTGENENNRNVPRNIVFYRVVCQLAEKLRSVFVPYFQYLLKGIVQLLGSGEDITSSKPRKKSKVLSESVQSSKRKSQSLTSDVWHLRYLIVSALHKCFLYDNVGFVDAEKFQMLLGPLIDQISVEKPSNTTESIPSSQDMDKTLVTCLGQMAITAGTDLLWKPLNHEVLLRSRSETIRVRILSLEIVKFLIEHLKEDYLALLPETIPFLAELLEDSELIVVAKSQEIIKLLEELSGESLSQYL